MIIRYRLERASVIPQNFVVTTRSRDPKNEFRCMTTYTGDKSKVLPVNQGEARFTDGLSRVNAIYTSNSEACTILIAVVTRPGAPIRVGLAHIDYDVKEDGVYEFFRRLGGSEKEVEAYIVGGCETNRWKARSVADRRFVTVRFVSTIIEFDRISAALVTNNGATYYAGLPEFIKSGFEPVLYVSPIREAGTDVVGNLGFWKEK